eukprot:CAMPEP_0171635412 /NCGR_PEP_ID=MMETSP0990-20121206/26648_1 /TAXON_ID=483369 /ORGANISM="non described non described, Strain CCMP2098" /LENGTH=97 /DNA_ID=CAMNT_0012207045 /DNA_START=47 /DNA_END=337 /DNA_ORIENTATION=+
MAKDSNNFKIVVFSEDMTDERLEMTLNLAKDAMGISDPSIPTAMRIFADHIRARLVTMTGKKGWNVICGRNFGSFVTHELRTYAYFTVCPGVNILVW